MLTVAILINGNPLMARSATNTGDTTENGETIYLVDDGQELLHHQSDGVIALSHKLLNTIKETKGK